MVFEYKAQVRYSEVDLEGNITIDSIVNYLQDAVMLHAETVGMGYRQIEKLGTVWFLSTWQIEILKIPRVYQNITVKTNPYSFKGFFGNRNVWIEDEDGNIMVRANSIWVYLDMKGKVPKRIEEKAVEVYYPLEDMLEMNYSARKIAMPPKFEPLRSIPVRHSQIDTNLHVNKFYYIKTAIEAADIRKMPGQLRAEYKKSALPGSTFYPYFCKDNEDIYIDLRDENGDSYATVVFEYGRKA